MKFLKQLTINKERVLEEEKNREASSRTLDFKKQQTGKIHGQLQSILGMIQNVESGDYLHIKNQAMHKQGAKRLVNHNLENRVHCVEKKNKKSQQQQQQNNQLRRQMSMVIREESQAKKDLSQMEKELKDFFKRTDMNIKSIFRAQDKFRAEIDCNKHSWITRASAAQILQLTAEMIENENLNQLHDQEFISNIDQSPLDLPHSKGQHPQKMRKSRSGYVVIKH